MPGKRRALVAPQNTFLESIIKRLQPQHCNFILANARIAEYPIIFVNDGFCKMSGFAKTEINMKSCLLPFMHGQLTDLDSIKKLHNACASASKEQIEVLLYKKNKSPIWLFVHSAPITNEDNAVVLLLLAFKDITAMKQPIEDDGKGLSKFARLARSITRNKAMLSTAAAPTTASTSTSSRPGSMKQSAIVHNAVYMNPLDEVPQYRQEPPKTPPFIILHYGSFKTIWDWWILTVTFYTAIMVPLNVAFKQKSSESIELLIIDSFVDIVFFVDIIFNFHTTFVGPSREVISDPRVIRRNYIRSWFVIDLLSCLPYDALQIVQSDDVENMGSLFSALKVLRLLRLGRVARRLDHYLEYGAAVLVLLVCIFMLISHWMACIWYTIGIGEAPAYSYGWYTELANKTDSPLNLTALDTSGPSKTMSYLTAMYFTLSCMTSVGFGNVSANTEMEKIFATFLMVLGALLYATIFGNITTIFQQMYSATARYHEILNNVRKFMRLHDVPGELQERVLDYIVSTWFMSKGVDSTKVLTYCPKDMKADICVHLNRTIFQEHPAFRLASGGCLRALAMHFTMSHTAPGDIIVRQGESVDSLCFVVSGSLEVIQDDEVVAILSASDVFGDAFWSQPTMGQAAVTVRTLTYSDLHIIRRDHLMEVLGFYRAFANSFARNLVLTYDLRKRLHFKKIFDQHRDYAADLKRREEATTIAELPSEHPMKKLIHRFRRMSQDRFSFGGGQSQSGSIGKAQVAARSPQRLEVPHGVDSYIDGGDNEIDSDNLIEVPLPMSRQDTANSVASKRVFQRQRTIQEENDERSSYHGDWPERDSEASEDANSTATAPGSTNNDLIYSMQVDTLKSVRLLAQEVNSLRMEMRTQTMTLEERLVRTEEQIEVLRQLVYGGLVSPSATATDAHPSANVTAAVSRQSSCDRPTNKLSTTRLRPPSQLSSYYLMDTSAPLFEMAHYSKPEAPAGGRSPAKLNLPPSESQEPLLPPK